MTVQAGDETGRSRVDYLVGCDGSRSVVRKLAGIGFPGTPAGMYGLLADVEPADPDDLRFGVNEGEHGTAFVLPRPATCGSCRAGRGRRAHPSAGGSGRGNVALADAVNLGWKPAVTGLGRAPDGLLDSYHSERHEAGDGAVDVHHARCREQPDLEGLLMRPDGHTAWISTTTRRNPPTP